MFKSRKKSVSLILALALFTNVMLCDFKVYADENDCYYVSLSGADSNDGSMGSPFRTLEAARNAIRERKTSGTFPSGGMTVYIREGVYYRDSSFGLDENDNNTAYKAYNGENVEITGKKVFSADYFQPVTGYMKDLLAEDVQDKVYVLNLSDIGLSASDIPKIQSSYVPDMEMPIITDGGTYVPVASDCGTIVHDSQYSWQWIDVNDSNVTADSMGYIANDFIGGWTYKVDEIYGYGYFRDYWSVTNHKVESINNNTNEVYFERQGEDATFDTRYSVRMKFINAYEALDSPGEWYVDYDSNSFYYYPLNGLNNINLECSWLAGNIFDIKNASNITIEDLKITGASMSSGVMTLKSDNISVLNCDIYLCGEAGVLLSEGSSNCRVDRCTIHDIGKTGVQILTLTANNTSLTHDNNVVSNNDISYTAWNKRTYGIGIRIEDSCGNIVRNNEIHDLTHSAIWFDGPENQILNNDIFNVLIDCGDSGAIYSVKNMRSMGTVVKNNHIHECEYNSDRETYGIYLDDSVSGITIESNILGPFAGSRNAVYINKGQENTIRHNIIIDHSNAAHWNAANLATWQEDIAQMNETNRFPGDENKYRVWYEKYPWLENIENKVNLNNTFEENALFYFENEPENPYLNIGGGTEENYYIGADRNLLITEGSSGYFTNSGSGKYQLTDDAINYIRSNYGGFENIVFSQIGIIDEPILQEGLTLKGVSEAGAGKINIGLSLNISSAEAENAAKAVIPLYAANGSMVSLKVLDVPNGGLNTDITFFIDRPLGAACRAEYLLLDENLKPVKNSSILNIAI